MSLTTFQSLSFSSKGLASEFDVEGSDIILQSHFEQVAEKFCSNTFVVSPVPFNMIADIDG